MKCYGTDEYGNTYSRPADIAPLGESVCGARETFDSPPKCTDNKRLIVENQKWQIIDLDKTLIKENGLIRLKTQIEKYETGAEEIPKGYKIVDKELVTKTLDEQLSDNEITKEQYTQTKNQPVISDLQNIDIKSVRALREWLNKQSDCPEFLKQYEKEASVKRSELVK